MSGESVIVRWCEESSETSGFRGGALDIGPLPWEDALGGWAKDLEHCGLVEERIQQSLEEKRPLHHESSIRTSVTTTIIFHPACARLYALVLRSLTPDGDKN